MIITRIAPSPTWPLHLWTVRTALFNWLLSKKNNWKFLLRIEDTDTTRSTKFFEEDIIQWLKWLWLDYDSWPDKEDEKWPYHQMERLNIYKKYINKLIEEWKAYYAWETAEELENMRKKAFSEKKPFVYRQINYTPEQIKKFKEEDRKPVVRFKVQPEKIKWKDLIKWEIEIDMSLVWDFVILKSDWIPTFYIANVIDDALMGVTHIIRWEDHVSNTPKQIQLYKALWFEIPQFGHLPLLLNPNKSKMSKRDTEKEFVTISKFREEWFLPEALINFIALLWWHPSSDEEFFWINIKKLKEKYNLPNNYKDLIESFNINEINDSNAIYDFQRALWFNGEYIRMLKDEVFVELIQDYLFKYGDPEWKEILNITEKDYWLKLTPYIKVRLQTFSQFKNYAKYFFKPQYPSENILYKEKMKVSKQLVKEILPKVINLLKNIDEKEWTEENLKNKLVLFIKENNLKNWQVLWPIRAILTWVEASPGAFEMLYILDKTESIKRLENFLENYLS